MDAGTGLINTDTLSTLPPHTGLILSLSKMDVTLDP